jgi:hypothetical protein
MVTRNSCAVYKGGRRQEEDGGRATTRRDEAQAAGRAPEARWRQDTQGEGGGAEQVPERTQRAPRHAQDRSWLIRLHKRSMQHHEKPSRAHSTLGHTAVWTWKKDGSALIRGYHHRDLKECEARKCCITWLWRPNPQPQDTASISYSKDALLSRMKISLWYALTLVHGCFDGAQEASLQICPAYLVKSVSRTSVPCMQTRDFCYMSAFRDLSSRVARQPQSFVGTRMWLLVEAVIRDLQSISI